MSTLEEKNRKKSKRSFIPKLPSFRRKKNNSPESTPSKSATKLKKQKNENTSNTKISVSIAKETQTPQEDPKYMDKSSCQDVKPYSTCLTSHKEEEQNGNSHGKSVPPLPNINTSLDISSSATSYTNPGYEGRIWHMENQNKIKICGNKELQSEINANISQKPMKSLRSNAPVSPVEFGQDVRRSSSTTSTLSSGSSLSLSSPGSVTKLVSSPKPYKSIFDDERRGIKRQGSTPSDVDIASSCISVSGSVSSLSPSREDIATKVTVRSVSTPGLQQYPDVAPVESLSPGVSPKHSHDNSKLEGAYTYDSSGGESQDSTNIKICKEGSKDLNTIQQSPENPMDRVMCSIVNLNFDLRAAAAASPDLNTNVGYTRHQAATCKVRHTVEGNTHRPVSEQQEGRGSTQAVRAEALISPSSAAVPNRGPANNNPVLESNCAATILAAEACLSTASHPVNRQLLASDSTSQCKTQCANVTATAECDQKKDEVVLTRVTSVTSPVPAKAQRIPYPAHHPIAQRIQLTAMRNKLRSESFDSSDLDSLASDDLMCETEGTFGELMDESFLQNTTMPGEQGFSPYQNTGKGKRLRNNSIEFLVASFDKRHRHHSTGQTYGSYTSSPRANLRAGGVGHLVGRETIVLDAGVYKHMVQELSSMKAALVKLGKMLQDPKALTEMLAATQQGQDASTEGGRTTKDSTTQSDQMETMDEQVQTDMQVLLSSQEACQMEEIQEEDRAVQSKSSSLVYKQCTECIVCDGSHIESDGMTKGSLVKTVACSPKEVWHAPSPSDVDESTGFMRESSNFSQDKFSHTGHSQSSGDTSDDGALQRSQQQASKISRKHVCIPDKNNERANMYCDKNLSLNVDSSPPIECRKLSSSDEGSIDSGSRLRYSSRVLGTKERTVSPNMKEKLSSSDDGCGSSSKVVRRGRNQSDSSEESEDSVSRGEKSKLPQLRRPMSRVQRPRQMQRPKTGQYQGHKPDGQVIPSKTRMQRLTHIKGNNAPQESTLLPHQRDQQNMLEWQQLQLQQQQDKLNKQHQAARKQQQETQQKLLTQQQKLQKEQQDMVSVNLQKQQEILVEQQHQQLKMQQLRQQSHQLKQHRSTDSSPLQSSHPKSMIMKRSSNQELTSAQHKSSDKESTTQELRHSSPDLVEGINFLSAHTAKVHHSEKQNGSDNQMMPPRSRLPGPTSVSKSPAKSNGNTGSKEGFHPTHVKNVANGIHLSKSKLQSPKFPRRPSPAVGMAKLQMHSPEQVAASCSNGSQKNPANHLQCNQNNSQSTHQTTVSTTRMTTTITTVTHPQSQSVSQVSNLPSPVKSSKRPTSRLVQPKNKTQSKIPKGSGIPVRGRDAL